MNINKCNSEIQIVPLAVPVYSHELIAAGARPLIGIKITGAFDFSIHNVVINIYGLSKSGFFIERTTVFSGELLSEKKSESIVFDLSDVKLNIRHDFFRALKNTADGKIYAEANIDGVKYMGTSPIKLLPSSVYPHIASPSVFTAFLSPCHPEIEKIANLSGKNLLQLYNALKNERFIYSVKECDFTSEDIVVSSIGDIFSRRSKMASPVEMAVVFCSCALCSGLFPVVAVLKGSGGMHSRMHILCGALKKFKEFGTLTSSHERLRSLFFCGELLLFDVSCLFTGHNVDFDNAIKNAYDALCGEELVFGLDIAASVCDGAVFGKNFGGEAKLIESIKRHDIENTNRHSLSDYAELLSDTAKTALLHFDSYSELSVSVMSGKDSLKTVSDIALSGKAIDFVPDSLPKDFCINAAALNAGKSNTYLACGFLLGDGLCAPVALYPVKVSRKGKESGVHLEFKSPKPYINRLLAEKLKGNPACRGYFERYGGVVPSGNLDSITAFYKNLCETVPNGYRLTNECKCAADIINYRDSLLAFSIVDKYDKIVSDKLCSAIISEKEYDGVTEADYSRKVNELLIYSPDIFSDGIYEAVARAADGDIVVSDACAEEQADIAAAVSFENIRLSHQTLIISESPAQRKYIAERIEHMGLGNAVLILSEDADIKKNISQKLISLSKSDSADLNIEAAEEKTEELRKLCEVFLDYSKSKSRIYDFDFSFDEAAKAYIRAGEKLSHDEKMVLLEPENLFFPDLGKKSAEEIFSAQIKLCRAAAVLCKTRAFDYSKTTMKYPLSKHPLYQAKLTKSIPDERAFAYLADKCTSELKELMLSCKEISEKIGFEINDIKSLPALHAYLSLIVLISKKYDSGISEALLMSDIYAVSKRLTELREVHTAIADCERELCEFDGGIYNLDGEKLFDDWLAQSDNSRSDITKTVNAYRTVSVAADLPKKSIPEVLKILSTRSVHMTEFASGGGEIKELFAGYWSDAGGIDWNKLSELTEFTKNALVLLKKIYGANTEMRRSAVGCFKKTAEFCADKLNAARVLGAAGLFDRMFSENGGIVTLASSLSADLYNMVFCNGIFSDKEGMLSMIVGWRENAGMLSAVAEYNICAEHCREIGLSCFVDYLETDGYTAGSEKIFMRSLLFLALKQIAFQDKKMLSVSEYEENTVRLSTLLSEKCSENQKMLIARHAEKCVEHINSNSKRACAFAESLADEKVLADELLLRYEDTVKAMFPIIIAEPSYAVLMSGFENEIICNAHNLHTERIIPALHCGSHKVILTESMDETHMQHGFVSDCRRAGVPIMPLKSEVNRFIRPCRINTKIEYKTTPVASFDRQTLVNVLEAQTIGLEIMKLIESTPGIRIGVCAFTENQRKALCEVIEVVAEKSEAVSRAAAEGYICVSSLSDSSSGCGKCDIVFISTVYGGEDVPQLAAAATEFPFGEGFSSKDLNSIISSCCAAKKIIVVSSMRKRGLECSTASDRLCGLALFNEYAISGGRMVSCSIAENSAGLYEPFLSEFCRIASENGFCVYTADGGKYAVLSIGGREYGAVIESSAANSVHSGRILKESGIAPIYIDRADVVLNPNKIADRIKTIEVENA